MSWRFSQRQQLHDEQKLGTAQAQDGRMTYDATTDQFGIRVYLFGLESTIAN